MKLRTIKQALFTKATALLAYIAKGDDALTEELERVGPMPIIKALLVLQALIVLTLTFLVVA